MQCRSVWSGVSAAQYEVSAKCHPEEHPRLWDPWAGLTTNKRLIGSDLRTSPPHLKSTLSWIHLNPKVLHLPLSIIAPFKTSNWPVHQCVWPLTIVILGINPNFETSPFSYSSLQVLGDKHRGTHCIDVQAAGHNYHSPSTLTFSMRFFKHNFEFIIII